MILTAEHLIDPVAYLQENTNITAGMQPGENQILSGADMDVWVGITNTGVEAEKYGRMESHVSPILGPLYVYGKAYGFSVGDAKVYAEWFPSPSAVKRMSEQLGRRLGVDVMRFVHSSDDTGKYGAIPAPIYANHLRAGEYPQSAGTTGRFNNFWHDRNYDHAIGTLLFPDAVTQRIISRAAKHDDYEAKKLNTAAVSISGIFDSESSAMGRIANRIWENLDGVTNEEAKLEVYQEAAIYHDYLPGKWAELPKVKLPNDRKRMIGDIIFAHFQDLLPKINALKPEYELVAA